MKKRAIALFLAALLLAVVAGCGAGGSTSAASSNAANDTAMMDAGEAGWEESAETATGASADFSAVRRNAKLILRADLSLETQSFDQTTADLEKVTADAGGYIEMSDLYGETGARTASYTIRVPQERFESFLAQVGETCHVVSRNTSQEDISEQYTDVETRLATLQTKHERLLALLDQAAKMEDIISLENALADCEYEIDSLTGQKRQYDSLVGYSTISLYVREVSTLTNVSEGTGFGAQLSQAAKNGLSGFTLFVRGLILSLVAVWPLLLILAVAGVIVWRVLRRRRAKMQEYRQAIADARAAARQPAPSAEETPSDEPPQQGS